MHYLSIISQIDDICGADDRNQNISDGIISCPKSQIDDIHGVDDNNQIISDGNIIWP